MRFKSRLASWSTLASNENLIYISNDPIWASVFLWPSLLLHSQIIFQLIQIFTVSEPLCHYFNIRRLPLVYYKAFDDKRKSWKKILVKSGKNLFFLYAMTQHFDSIYKKLEARREGHERRERISCHSNTFKI